MSTTLEDSNLDVTTYGFIDEPEPTMDHDLALAMTLLRSVIPVIVLMGTIGNTLSFCVLVRRHMRSTPMYFYLTLLAVADTFVLYVSAFKVWIRHTSNCCTYPTSAASCSCSSYSVRSTCPPGWSSSWRWTGFSSSGFHFVATCWCVSAGRGWQRQYSPLSSPFTTFTSSGR